MRSLSQLIVRCSQATDALVIAAAIALTWRPVTFRMRELFLVLLVVPACVFFLQYFELYESHRLQGLFGATRATVSAQIIVALGLAAGAIALRIPSSLYWIFKFWLLSTALILVQRWVLYIALHLARRSGLDVRNVLLIGSWEKAEKIAESFASNPEWGLRLAGVGTGPTTERQYWSYPDRQTCGSSLEDILRSEVVDELLINVSPDQLPAERASLQSCQDYGLVGRVLLDMLPAEPARSRLSDFNGLLSIAVGAERHDTPKFIAKRGLDIVISSICIIAFAPVMLIVAGLVKLSSAGPIFYCQERAGWNGRKFLMYKFRTMLHGSDSLQASLANQTITRGPIYKNPNDWRITPVGRMLRRFSLDELPQLFNVLKGDMSMVGPRPLPLLEAREISGPHRRRFSMRPGITCLWQVNGRSTVEYAVWMKYDVEYVDQWTIWLDAKLLLQTIPAVLSGRGAY